MNAEDAALVSAEIEAITRRAEQAETDRDRYGRERDEARAILARVRTSLNEAHNDPADDGRPATARTTDGATRADELRVKEDASCTHD